MLQLLRQQAADFVAHALHIPHQHREFFLARQCQQRALRGYAQLARIALHAQHAIALFFHHVAAEGFQPLLDFHIDIASGFSIELEAVLLHVLALGGHGFEFQRLGLRQYLRPDLWRLIRPIVRLLAIFGLGIRMMYRQHPRAHFAGDFFFVRVSRYIHHQDAIRLQALILRQRELHALQRQAVQPRHHDRLLDCRRSAVAAA